MPTSAQSELTTGTVLDVLSYQQFWESISPDVLARYQGQCVALRCDDQGWHIIDAADDFEQLQKSLSDSGANLSELVFDQIHTDDHTAAGIELQ